jgi:hypothetical protein
MIDVTTGTTSAWSFSNHPTAIGASTDFGYVNYGDTLVFEIDDLNINQIFASDPAYSLDGVNHGYVTSFAGGQLFGANIPAGVYVGMEDLNARNSDFDYNDDIFLFTNVGSKGLDAPPPPPDNAPIPEPNSLILLGTGFVALGRCSTPPPRVVLSPQTKRRGRPGISDGLYRSRCANTRYPGSSHPAHSLQ